MALCPVSTPGQPFVTVISATSTSISLSWSVPSDSVVDNYVVTWQEISSNAISGDSDYSETNGSAGGDPITMADGDSGTSGSITDTSYTMEGLKSSTNYIITVTVTNAAGSRVSYPIRITTGKIQVYKMQCNTSLCYTVIICTFVKDKDLGPVIGGVSVTMIFIISVTVMVVVVVRNFSMNGRRK